MRLKRHGNDLRATATAWPLPFDARLSGRGAAVCFRRAMNKSFQTSGGDLEPSTAVSGVKIVIPIPRPCIRTN